MKRFIWLLILGLVLLWSVPPGFAASTSVDSLIKKLVDKGVLTEKEGLELKGEIAADEKLVREEGFKQGLPSWIQDTKLKGDFRLRYQFERKSTDLDARERGRIRYRLGLETKINDQVKVGAGLASGADDPRSTNQTFTDTFERSDIRLDYAYAEYTPVTWAKVIGGIYPRTDYLWQPTDMVWDSDITIHGGSAHFEHPMFGEQLTPYLNTGVLVIDEISNTTTADKPDPYLWYTQVGSKLKEGDWSANVAGTYYGFNATKGACPDWTAGTNTGVTSPSGGSCTGGLNFDYDSIGVSAELALATPFDMDFIPEVGIFGDLIHNVDTEYDTSRALTNLDDGDGWSIGARLGDKKVVSKGQWQLKYIFAELGKDAFVDFTPDSDRYGGRTDMRSHEGILEYGLNKNVSLALDYYQSKRIKATEAAEHIIQADINVKF